MARIPLIDPDRATGEVAETFELIKQAMGGKVTNLWRALANNPKMLRAVWDRRAAVMGSGALDQVTKEAIALAVSEANACKYCVTMHTASLGRIGESPERIEQILQRRGENEAEQHLLDVVVKSSLDPHSLRDEDFDRLRALGYSDQAVFDAIGIATHYTGVNKFLDTFLVDLD